MTYKTDALPESKRYKIEVLHNEEVKRDTYWAVNKTTGVPELPFMILSDAKKILEDLEGSYSTSDDKVVNLREVH